MLMMQRVAWDNLADYVDRVSDFVDVVVHFMAECKMYDPMIHTAYTLFEGCKTCDKFRLGYTNISR
jgi:hypothetical protein